MFQMVVAIIIAVVMGMLSHPLFGALIDWQQHQKWKNGKLQETVDEVEKNGKAPIVTAVLKPYDKNQDNFIDRDEVQAIKEYLQQFAPKKP
jgi:uncharacterized membrane protein (DUF106 family)